MWRPKSRSKTFACFLLLTVSPLPALAQVSVLPELLISANQAPIEASKAGASVTVLRGAELQARGIVTAADALRSVPGVSVTQTGNAGSLTQVRIRGSEANEVLVTIDGVPAQRLDFGDFDWADFLIDDIDRIEVVRGPQSGIHGATAHAGVITIITRSGKGLTRPEVEARVEPGTQNSHRESASARGAIGPFYGAVSIQNRETDGHNIARSGFERDGHRGLIASGKAGIDIGPLNVEGSIRHVDRVVEFDPEFTIPLADGFGYDKFRSTQGRIVATHTAFDGRLIQRFGASIADQYYFDEIGFGPFVSRAKALFLVYKGTVKYDTRLFGGEQHSVSLVVDQAKEHYGHNFGADARRERRGIAGEHVVDFQTGLTLSSAVRQDFNDAFENALTWRFTASQRIASTGTRIHASLGKGITNPTFVDQFGFALNFIPNPALQPESSIGWDIGVEQSYLGGRLVTDITYFSADFENKIETLPTGGGSTMPVNIPGVSPRRGIEFAAKYTPADWLMLDASYTYTDSKLANGLTAIRRPRHTAALDATLYSPDRRGRASLGVVYNGEMQDGDTFNIPGRVPMPAYTVVRAILSYELTKYATAYVRAENLFDARYEEIFSYRAPGFTAYAGMKLKLGGE
jgi:vitamin B12 transporter